MHDDDDDIPALGRNPERTPDASTTPAGAEGGMTTPRATTTGDALSLASYLHSVNGGEVGGGADRGGGTSQAGGGGISGSTSPHNRNEQPHTPYGERDGEFSTSRTRKRWFPRSPGGGRPYSLPSTCSQPQM